MIHRKALFVQPPSSVPHEPQADDTSGMTSGRSATSSAVTGVRHTSHGTYYSLHSDCGTRYGIVEFNVPLDTV